MPSEAFIKSIVNPRMEDDLEAEEQKLHNFYVKAKEVAHHCKTGKFDSVSEDLDEMVEVGKRISGLDEIFKEDIPKLTARLIILCEQCKAESWKENFRKECKMESFLVSILLTEAFRNVMVRKFGDKKTVVDPQDAELFGIKLALEVFPNYAKNIRICSDIKSSIDTLNRCLSDQAKLNGLNDRVRDKVNDIISLVNEKQDTQIVFEHLDRNVRPTADAVANFAKKHFGDQAGEIRKVSVRGQYD